VQYSAKIRTGLRRDWWYSESVRIGRVAAGDSPARFLPRAQAGATLYPVLVNFQDLVMEDERSRPFSITLKRQPERLPFARRVALPAAAPVFSP
jgi:hypothetical protein